MNLEEKCIFFKEKGYTYDSETGIVKNHIGKIVTGKNSGGYIILITSLNYKTINLQAHQYGWYITYGKIPVECIDHINRNRFDNRIFNLRLVTYQQNSFNTNAKGYYWNKQVKKFHAQIQLNGKVIFLGHFNTPEEARQAYLEAKKQYHIIPSLTEEIKINTAQVYEKARRDRIKELFLNKNQPSKSEVKFSAIKNNEIDILEEQHVEVKSYDDVVNIYKGVSVERVHNFFNKNLQPKIPNYLEYFTTTDENIYKKFAVETSNYLMNNYTCRKDMLEQFNEYREIVKTKEHQSLIQHN